MYPNSVKASRFTLTNWLSIVVLMLITALATAQPQNIQTPPPPEKVRLQLKWFNQFQFAGYYAAIEQGYYAQNNLDVELLERTLSQNVVQQVVTGEAEYGIGDSGLLSHYAQGAPIVALAAIFQHNPLVFFSRQDSGISSPFEIKGRTIMSDISSADEAPLRAMLTGANIKPEDYTLLPQKNDYGLLGKKQIDVISGYLTDQPFYFKEKGIKINIINPQNYGIDFYGDMLFTSTRELRDHPERVKRFRQASLLGWQYAMAHPEEMIQLIRNKYHSKLSVEHLRFEAREAKKLILPGVIPIGQIQPERIKAIAKSFSDSGHNKPLSDTGVADFIYTGKASQLNLTDAEKAWLAAHPVLRVGVDSDFAPYEWIDEQGHYVGMAADYMKLLEKKLGVRFEIIHGKSWDEILNMAKRGELELLACANKTPERSQYLTFSEPYKSAFAVIIDSGQGNFIGNLQNLAGRRVAVENGYFMQELMAKHYPKIQLIPTTNTTEALKLVLNGAADAYVGDAGTANYMIKKNGFLSLRFSGQTEYHSIHSVAATKSHPELATIIFKAISSIPKEESDAIFNRWLGLKIEQGFKAETLIQYGAGAGLLFLLFGYWVYRLRREIDQRKILEKSVEENREKYRALSEAAFEAIFISEHGLGLEQNRQASALFGYSDQEIIGKPGIEFIAEKDRALVKHNMSSGYELPYEALCLHKNGATFPAIICGKMMHYRGRDVRVTSITDVTEQKNREAQIRTMLSEQKAMLENDLIGIVRVKDRTIIWANPAYEKIMGYQPGEMTGMPTRQNFANDKSYLELGKVAYPLLESGKVFRAQLEHVCKNGQRIWVDMSGSMLNSTRGESLWAFLDITDRKRTETILQATNLKMNSLLSSMAEGAYGIDTNGHCTFVNPSFLRILGYEHAEEVIGAHIHELIHHSHADGTIYPAAECKMYMAYQKNEKAHSVDEVFWRRDGSAIPVEYWAQPIVIDGVITGVIATFIDISERKLAEAQLVESESRLRAIIENEPECIKIVDAQGKLTQMNPAGLKMIEADSLAQIAGHNILELIAPEYRQEFSRMHQRVLAGETVQMEFEILGLKGGRRVLETHAVPMKEYGQTVQLAVTRDITERKKLEADIHQLAFYDTLTHLPNRRLMNERLAHAIMASRRSERYCALMFLDLDNFKPLNDTHGHVVGDALLVEVARRLKTCVREIDTVSRFGGDEFTVMLSELDVTLSDSVMQAQTIAEKIRGSLAEPYLLTIRHEGVADTIVKHHCSVSIGIAVFIGHDAEGDEILKWADAAMYQAKAAGRNQICFYQGAQA
ncbi:PAS domain S-box protein [Gallionella capsiferriformans]|uniref:Diguanylate cyclase with PAS/PAC sensor n=1 Tax=Gallionella capsiferriformans (strain ES-2) TaxID=395494 RepID=D9SH81_GALCS|nr:PAS domain S-box protein [Gallionella capsiferriformans]ADL55878.1 diguanylate cyclase with PAS/PAC sensor [Gallionella capsiferriformans ES-2]